jgi:4-hydroxybenzoate polyprenyltransferase
LADNLDDMSLEKIYQYFRLCRPAYWPLVLIMVYLGVIVANNGLPTDTVKTLLIFFHAILFSSGAFSLNQIFDADVDRLTTRNTSFGPIPNNNLPIASGKISKRKATIFSIFLSILTLVISYFINFNIVFLTLFGILLFIFYSVPPIRLKSRSPFDAITNAIGFGVLCPAFGILGFNTFSFLIFTLPLFFILFILTFGLYIPTTITDYKWDKKFKIKTFAVKYGIKNSAKYSSLIQLLGIILSLILFYQGLYQKVIIATLPFSLLFMISTLVIYFSPKPRTAVLVYSPAMLSCVLGLPLILTLISVI